MSTYIIYCGLFICLVWHTKLPWAFTLYHVIFTHSYGGQLSTYMRFKYPFIVDGAIAASAPIFQVAGIVSGQLFWNAVTMVRKCF